MPSPLPSPLPRSFIIRHRAIDVSHSSLYPHPFVFHVILTESLGIIKLANRQRSPGNFVFPPVLFPSQSRHTPWSNFSWQPSWPVHGKMSGRKVYEGETERSEISKNLEEGRQRPSTHHDYGAVDLFRMLCRHNTTVYIRIAIWFLR